MTFPLKRVSRHIATEMIDLQDSSFGQQLEKVVEIIRTGVLQKEYSSYEELVRTGHIKTLEQMIFARTGLQMEMIVSGDPAAILSFYINKHSIFLDSSWHGVDFSVKQQQGIIDKARNKTGTIDLKKAKVDGIFSEYKNKLFINFHILIGVYQLTSAEIVAVMLHEIGHAFYMCEFSDRLESTNQVLANVAREILSKKEKNLTYVYKELKSIDDTISEETIDGIVNGNRVIAGYKLFKVILNSVFSQMSHAKYDETSFEQLADHFPSRFGYGKSLIVALDKMHDYFGNPEKFQAYNTLNFFNTNVSLIGTLVALAASIVTGPIVAALGVLLIATVIEVSDKEGEHNKDYTYDKLKIRYKRIRSVYIDSLKGLDVSTENMKGILDNIYAIDRIINNTHVPTTLYSALSNLLFSNAKKAEKSIREQQLLEDLAFNDFFLRSAEFKTL